MSKKKLDISVLFFLIILGSYYIYTALNLKDKNVEGDPGTGFFPIILGVMLIIFSLIGILKWLKKPDETVAFGNQKIVILTIILVSVYFLFWEFVGFFFLITFLFLLVLFTIYRLPLKIKLLRLLTINSLISFGLTFFIYILFNKLMYIDF